MAKHRLLFILHLPPPVHGAAMVGKLIKESSVINHSFTADYINLSTSASLQMIGRTGIRKFIRLLRLQFNVWKALIRRKYKVVYMTLNSGGPGFYKDMLTVAALKLFGKRIIYHFHNKGVTKWQGRKLDNLLYKIAFHRARAILLSPQLYCDVRKYIRKEDVFFCANGIPGDAEMLSPAKVKDPGAPCRLLFLSNMMAEKGVLVLLEACTLLKKSACRFACDFVGDWFDISEREFTGKVLDAGLDQHVFAHGKKYGAEKWASLSGADIFVFPTRNDCFPLVVLEAMAFGLPVVSTGEGGIPDMVADGETGFLVPTGDAVSLAEKLECLVRQPGLRATMGTAARKRYETFFTLEIFERNMKNILEEVSGET